MLVSVHRWRMTCITFRRCHSVHADWDPACSAQSVKPSHWTCWLSAKLTMPQSSGLQEAHYTVMGSTQVSCSHTMILCVFVLTYCVQRIWYNPSLALQVMIPDRQKHL